MAVRKTSGRSAGSGPLRLPVAVVLGALVAAVASTPAGARVDAPAAKRALTKVTIRTDWFANGTHAGFYAAKNKGYYEAVGLDVEIQEGRGSASTVQLVGSGQNTFGFVAPVAMIPAVQVGAKVMMVAGVLQNNPAGILVRADSDIRTPKDLEGKLCAESPFGYIHKMLPALWAKTGVDGAKVRRVSLAPDALVPGMAQKRFDAMCDMLFEDIYLRSLGVPTRVFRFSDYGINVLAHGIVVNRSTIEQQPGVVRAFVKASLRGINWAFQNPFKAVGVIQTEVPNSPSKPQDNVAILKLTKKRSVTPNTKGKPLGWMSRKDWIGTMQIMFQYLDLPRANAPGIDQLYTNAFLPNQAAPKK